MAVNPYINNFYATNEQKLFDDLSIEYIKFYGLDFLYLPRTVINEDEIFHEDRLADFQQVVEIEMYIKDVEQFQGDGDFLSKFGLQIRDSLTVAASITRCKEILGETRRPMEGDLVYFPLNKKMFEVTFVEHEAGFYQRGALYYYELKLELFEYANEKFSTGNTTIDRLFDGVQTTEPKIVDHIEYDPIEDLEEFDPIADNKVLQDFADGIIDFSEGDPYSAGGKW